MTKIDVVSYDPLWKNQYSIVAAEIRNALKENCVEIYHVGSTAVDGLCAKPKIDIVGVAVDGSQAISSLEDAGFLYKGELNIPFKFGFTKRSPFDVNLHLFEPEHPEIMLNLMFRDHLRIHPESLKRYANLKKTLLADDVSHLKQNGQFFTGYNLGKDDFIRDILEREGFNLLRFVRVTHNYEWEHYHRIRRAQIFDPNRIVYDETHPTLTDPRHHHFLLCYGVKPVSTAHVEFINESDAVLRTLATDAPYKRKGYGRNLIQLLEKWVKKEGRSILKLHANPTAELFYRRLGYKDVLFDEPSIQQNPIDLGKIL